MGGLLTQHLDWRWIFFVNLPISVVAIAMTLRYVGESSGEQRGRLDLTGLVTFTAAAALATYALIKGNDYGWGSTRTIGVFAGAAVALIAFVVTELVVRAPLLDLSLFRRGTFTGVMIGALLLSGAAFSYLAYESLWLQSVLGMGPVTAGLCFLPMSVAAFFTAALAGRFLEERVPAGLQIGLGLLLIGSGAAAQAMVDATSDWTVLVLGLATTGVGVGLSTPMLVSAAVNAVGYQRAGMASGAVNTARQLGNALGIAVLGVLFHSGLSNSAHDAGIGDLTDRLASGQSGAVLAQTAPERRAALDHLIHAAFASGLRSAVLARR
ncbi:MFS transporter [Catenulispora yoronensis]